MFENCGSCFAAEQFVDIKMYIRQKEHNPPHIHAIHGDCIGMFSLEDGEMFEGDLSSKEQKMVRHFISCHKDELLNMWEYQQFRLLSYDEK